MVKILKNFDYYQELVEVLFKNKSAFFVSNFIAPMFIIYFLKDFVPTTFLLSFLLAQFILGFFRVYVSKQGLMHIKNNKKYLINKYLKYYIFIIFANSVLLGVALVFSVFYAEQLQVFILTSLLFGLVAGSMSTLTSVFHAIVAFIIPFITIFILGLLSSGITTYYILAMILSLYIFITIPTGFRIFTALKNNIEKAKMIVDQKEQLILHQEQLFQTEKMASLGEMIANIAHQWRQPLSVITASSSGLQLHKECGTLDDELLSKSLNDINNSANYLSQTIDTFRNFIKEERVTKEVIIQDRIDNTLNIIEATLKSNYIKVKNNIDYSNPIKLTLVVGELSQVLINIINNAKDILLEKNIKDAWIKLDLLQEQDIAIITIEDNGGGIPDDILPRIFEPYFTTKHESQGTGLGLHMSYRIITESLKGKLYANNTKNGAKFYIELPLNL